MKKCVTKQDIQNILNERLLYGVMIMGAGLLIFLGSYTLVRESWMDGCIASRNDQVNSWVNCSEGWKK
jgi:hypothetical protein